MPRRPYDRILPRLQSATHLVCGFIIIKLIHTQIIVFHIFNFFAIIAYTRTLTLTIHTRMHVCVPALHAHTHSLTHPCPHTSTHTHAHACHHHTLTLSSRSACSTPRSISGHTSAAFHRRAARAAACARYSHHQKYDQTYPTLGTSIFTHTRTHTHILRLPLARSCLPMPLHTQKVWPSLHKLTSI